MDKDTQRNIQRHTQRYRETKKISETHIETLIIIETQTEIQRLRPRDTHGDTQRHIKTDMETKRVTGRHRKKDKTYN